jgi:hypothetical protein
MRARNPTLVRVTGPRQKPDERYIITSAQRNGKGAAKSRSLFFQAIAPVMAWTIRQADGRPAKEARLSIHSYG